jgi:HAD superfamily hydrolase (TIGR01509 family)
MPQQLRAIVFDFNGVLADDETPHLLCFQEALREHGLTLTKEDYYGPFLGMDERMCAELLLRAKAGAVDRTRLQSIIDRKAALFRDYAATHKPELFPGVVPFVKQAAGRYRLAIASGGWREQIDYALRGTPIEGDFDVIVAADDVAVGKPDPGIYLHTLKLLNAIAPRPPLIRADECVVIEDSRAGILSAQAAGMRVAAVATTYPAPQLGDADLVVSNPAELTMNSLHRLVADRSSSPLEPS